MMMMMISVPSLTFVGLAFRLICLNISRPCDLDLWPLTSKLGVVGWAIFLPILVFLERFVLDLSANTCLTRRQVTLQP